jgi:hypothetical protein
MSRLARTSDKALGMCSFEVFEQSLKFLFFPLDRDVDVRYHVGGRVQLPNFWRIRRLSD